jgi:hypothetical protein
MSNIEHSIFNDEVFKAKCFLMSNIEHSIFNDEVFKAKCF